MADPARGALVDRRAAWLQGLEPHDPSTFLLQGLLSRDVYGATQRNMQDRMAVPLTDEHARRLAT